MKQATPRILMVCLGNICRSPMAEGVLRHEAQARGIDLFIDSAGTSNWHVGQGPDARATANLREKGIDISRLQARQFVKSDFEQFDLILTMDDSNLSNVSALAESAADMALVKPMLDFGYPGEGKEVPDPYFGGDDGFEEVYRLLQTSCKALLDSLDT